MIDLKHDEIGLYRPSILVLILVNALPLIGVFVWDWSAFEIVALYWLENVIIGFFNILKMITCKPGQKEIDEAVQRMAKSGGTSPISNSKGCVHGIKFFLVPFFTIHYFGFCAGHGFFVYILLGGLAVGGTEMMDPGEIFPTAVATFSSGPMLLAIGGLFASHLFSFLFNYIGKAEYRKVTPDFLMAAPYGRIFVLHVAIIFGGWGIAALGSPVVLLVLLVILKTFMDVGLHIRSHQKMNRKNAPTPSS